jgi:hypothetical protein
LVCLQKCVSERNVGEVPRCTRIAATSSRHRPVLPLVAAAVILADSSWHLPSLVVTDNV